MTDQTAAELARINTQVNDIAKLMGERFILDPKKIVDFKPRNQP